jgi:hypothetical protein|nr:MAG TPA: hypothetical protein [Crassvirales sp.]
MRKCIVVVNSRTNCASLFQRLNKNNKGLEFASWTGVYLLLIKILVLKEILVGLISLKIKIILKLLS